MLNFCLTKSAENIDSLKNTYISDRMQTKSYEISNTEDLALNKGPVLLNLFFFLFWKLRYILQKERKLLRKVTEDRETKTVMKCRGLNHKVGTKPPPLVAALGEEDTSDEVSWLRIDDGI